MVKIDRTQRKILIAFDASKVAPKHAVWLQQVGIVSKDISEPVDRLTLFGVPSVWPFAKRLHITNR
jgi:hypothetical protein